MTRPKPITCYFSITDRSGVKHSEQLVSEVEGNKGLYARRRGLALVEFIEMYICTNPNFEGEFYVHYVSWEQFKEEYE